MPNLDYTIRLEQLKDSPAIDRLTEVVFGPGMFARAAYVLREGVPHEADLSFVAVHENTIVGSVRLTSILWGNSRVLMLGPLGVLPSHKNKGIGKALMEATVSAAGERARDGGSPLIVLVGDREYYAPFGFVPVAPNRITLPRPVDPSRVLACELQKGTLAAQSGAATKVS